MARLKGGVDDLNRVSSDSRQRKHIRHVVLVRAVRVAAALAALKFETTKKY